MARLRWLLGAGLAGAVVVMVASCARPEPDAADTSPGAEARSSVPGPTSTSVRPDARAAGPADAPSPSDPALGVPLSIGTRSNRLGSDPDSEVLSDEWIVVDGPGTAKAEGNRYNTIGCSSAATYGCSANPPATSVVPSSPSGPRVANNEYDVDGSFFTVEVLDDPAAGDLVIEVFDPAFVAVGNDCEDGLPTLAEQARLARWYEDVSRYESGIGEWCTGDMAASQRADARTTFMVRSPDATPDDDTDNPLVEGVTCRPRTFDAYDPVHGPSVAQLLDPSDGVDDVAAERDPTDRHDRFAEVFRRWVTVCRIPAADVVLGEYVVQVRTNAAEDPTEADPSILTAGHNRFAIRAERGDPVTGPPGVVVAGRANVALTVNDRGEHVGLVELTLRMVPVTRGGTIELGVFDLSDSLGTQSPTVLSVLDAQGAALPGCEFHSDTSQSLDPGPGECSVQYAPGELNERLLTVRAPAPATCEVAAAGGCELVVRLASLAGAPIHDTISFGGRIRDAVRVHPHPGSADVGPVEPVRPDAPPPRRVVPAQ